MRARDAGSAVEWVVAVLLTLASVAVHVRFFLHAGPLWRDEINSVELSTGGSIGQIWRDLEYDSFPLLWHLALRGWISVVGGSDLQIRLLGLLAGVGLLAALWLAGGLMARRPPAIALALLGFSTAVICYGDSIRGYGLGMLLGVVAVIGVWRFVSRPTIGRGVAAAALCLLSVHLLYYNSVIVFAACLGGMAAFLSCKQYRDAGWALLIGVPAALSLVVYVPVFRSAARWNMTVRYDVDLEWVWSKLAEAVAFLPGNPWEGPSNRLIWTLVFIGSLIIAVRLLGAERRSSASPVDRRLLMFSLVFLAAGSLAYLLFLLSLSYFMQPWYFLAVLCLVAVGVEGISLSGSSRMLVLGRSLLALVMALLWIMPLWADAGVRKTNMDHIAERVQQLAGPQDLIVVSPWYYGVSFERNYSGATAWTAAPPVPFLKFHRYDLLKEQMVSPDAVMPVEQRMAQTLSGGGRVWLVAYAGVGAPQVRPPPVPAPHPRFGWYGGPYDYVWLRQVQWLLRRHAGDVRQVEIKVDQPVSSYESPILLVAKGWRP